jgi:ABC-type transporter Mla MlaB component
MLRLTVRSRTSEEAVLQVDGWVAEGQVLLLAQEGTRLLRTSRRLVLDLKGVVFIDEAGLALLQEWEERVRLQNGSSFIRELLVQHHLDCENEEPSR